MSDADFERDMREWERYHKLRKSRALRAATAEIACCLLLCAVVIFVAIAVTR